MSFLDIVDPGDIAGFQQDKKIAQANAALNNVLKRG